LKITNMIRTIAKKEITTALRNSTYRLLYFISLALLGIAVAGGYSSYHQQWEERQAATTDQRQKWLNQDPKHPHIAAHFGNFAYMPKTALSLFDPGLDVYTGTVLYMEPHRQNDFSFKAAEEQDAALRFGELSAALILQVLFPLFIIFIGYSALSAEREQSTLPLIYSQGISFRTWFAGKWLGQAALVGLLFLPAVLLVYGTEFWSGAEMMVLLRTSLLLSLYAIYLSLFIGLTLLVSAYSRSSKGSLLLLLSAWTVLVILLPKWAANAGDRIHPLPSKYEFRDAITRDINNGINGHDPRSTRAQTLK
jgi:ABC-2 type transport system permease protein